MKTKIKLIIILAIYFCLILLCTNVQAVTGTIIAETVRLREEPSTDSNTVLLIAIDEEVEIIDQDGEWYNVSYNDGENTYTGYIRQDMLEVDGEIESQDTEDDTSKEDESSETTEDSSQDEETTETDSTSEDSNEDDNTSDQNGEETNTDVAIAENETEFIEGMQITILENVEIRMIPLINMSVIGTIKADTEVTITEIIGNWCYIETKNQSGWAMISKIATETIVETDNEDNNQENEEEEGETSQEETEEAETAETTVLYVNVTTVNLREEPNSSSEILEQLSLNTKVNVLEEVDNVWSQVEVSGITGYIASQYLSETETTTTSRGSNVTRTQEEEETTTTNDTKTSTSETSEEKESSSSSSSSSSSTSSSTATGEDVVTYAKTFLGCKYVYGGSSPSGFDCSGFTQYVYKHFGYTLDRDSTSQRSNGVAVSKSNLQAGDLVCFSGHVGIYVGSNQFIHAENESTGVTISSLSESYYLSKYITARRIIQ